MCSQKNWLTGLLAVSTLGSSAAFAAGERYMNGKSLYGEPVAEIQSSRMVDMTKVKSLNVRCGDRVTFVNGGAKFAWQFDSEGHGAVPLTKIAPAGFGLVDATVYVGRNENETGG